MKDYNPFNVSEFVVTRGISDEPVFSWWGPFILKNRDIIIAHIKLRVNKKTHRFGIEVPMSIENFKLLNAKNVDTLWQEAIAKDIYQV